MASKLMDDLKDLELELQEYDDLCDSALFVGRDRIYDWAEWLDLGPDMIFNNLEWTANLN